MDLLIGRCAIIKWYLIMDRTLMTIKWSGWGGWSVHVGCQGEILRRGKAMGVG
jgi:hypothetical protein